MVAVRCPTTTLLSSYLGDRARWLLQNPSRQTTWHYGPAVYFPIALFARGTRHAGQSFHTLGPERSFAHVARPWLHTKNPEESKVRGKAPAASKKTANSTLGVAHAMQHGNIRCRGLWSGQISSSQPHLAYAFISIGSVCCVLAGCQWANSNFLESGQRRRNGENGGIKANMCGLHIVEDYWKD